MADLKAPPQNKTAIFIQPIKYPLIILAAWGLVLIFGTCAPQAGFNTALGSLLSTLLLAFYLAIPIMLSTYIGWSCARKYQKSVVWAAFSGVVFGCFAAFLYATYALLAMFSSLALAFIPSPSGYGENACIAALNPSHYSFTSFIMLLGVTPFIIFWSVFIIMLSGFFSLIGFYLSRFLARK